MTFGIKLLTKGWFAENVAYMGGSGAYDSYTGGFDIFSYFYKESGKKVILKDLWIILCTSNIILRQIKATLFC